MRKNVWIINHYASNTYFEKGGRHYWFAKFLKKKGYNPVVFCANSMHGEKKCYFNTDELFVEKVADDIDVPFIFVKTRPYGGNGIDRIYNMIEFYFNVNASIKKYSKKKEIRPDVIIGSSVHPLASLAAIKLAKHFKCKNIVEIRDLWPESIVEYMSISKNNPIIKLLYALEKTLYKQADNIIFVTEGLYDYIKEKGWENSIPKEKIHCISNGIDLATFYTNKNTYTIHDADLDNKDCFKVVYTGSIRKVNNLGLLLDIAKSVSNNKILFLLWGDGDERVQLEKRTRDEGISNVIFKGRVEKKYIPYIVSSADLNIVHNTPSNLFRFGISFNKMFEYMASGKPILFDFLSKHNPLSSYDFVREVSQDSYENVAKAIDDVSTEKVDTFYNKSSQYMNYVLNYDYAILTQKLIQIIELS